jgi:hypothetical protein
MNEFGVQVKQQNLPTRATTVFFFVLKKKNPCHLLVLFRSKFDGLFTHR